MAVAFPTSSNTGNATNTTTRSPAVPSGAAINDVMFAFHDYWNSGTDATITPPSGWTLLYKISGGTGTTGVMSRCFWKRLTAADSGTYTFTAASAGFTTVDVLRATGVKTSGDPVGTNFASTWVGSTTAFPSVSVSPTYAAGLIWHGYNDSGGTHTPPTGYTEQIDVDCASDAWLIAGAGGTFTASGAVSTVASARHASLVAVEPDTGAAPARTRTMSKRR